MASFDNTIGFRYTRTALSFAWLLLALDCIDGYSLTTFYSTKKNYSTNSFLPVPAFGIVRHPSSWSSSHCRRHQQQQENSAEIDVDVDVDVDVDGNVDVDVDVDDNDINNGGDNGEVDPSENVVEQPPPSDAALYFLMTSGYGKLPSDVASQVQSSATQREETNRRALEKEGAAGKIIQEDVLQKEWETRKKAQESAQSKSATERAMLQKQYWAESLMKGVGKKGSNLYPEKKEREMQLEQPMKVEEIKDQGILEEEEEETEKEVGPATIASEKEKDEFLTATPDAKVANDLVGKAIEKEDKDASPEAKAEEQASALKEEEGTNQKAQEEEEAKLKAQQQQQEAILKAQQEEEEARLKAEAEARVKAEEQERLKAEAKAAETERLKREQEEEAQRQKEIEEQIRLQKEKEEAEARELAAAEEEAQKLEEQEEAMLNLQPLTDKATGVKFESKLGPGRYLMGVGVRKKAIINIYAVAMYSGAEVKKALEPLSPRKNKKDAYQTLRDVARSTPTTFLLEMVFKTGAETMANAIAESVGSRFSGDSKEVNQLKKLIFDGVSTKGAATKGTTFEFDCTDDGLTITVDGETQGTVHSISLSQAFCDVYLDDKTVSAQLRDSCLENCCVA